MNKYSIILPVRNGGNYVKDCVNSILSQTLRDFNFIVLDNCSTDGTREWIESLNDPRIIIHPSSVSLSIEENWGRVKDIKKNEFITLIGHDDILYPEFLETIDKLVVQHPTASLYHTHFDFIDGDGKLRRHCKPMPATLTGNEFLQHFLLNRIDLMGTGYLMRAADYDRLGGIPVHYPSLLFADFDLWLRLASINYEVISEKNCFAFRVHKSTTGTAQDQQLHKALNKFVEFLSLQMNSDQQRSAIIKESGAAFLMQYVKSYSHRLLRTRLDQRNGLSIKAFINEAKHWAVKLGVEEKFHPGKNSSVKLALMIDSNSLSRGMFLLFKKLYTKPVLSK